MNYSLYPDKLTVLIDTVLGRTNTSAKDGTGNTKKLC